MDLNECKLLMVGAGGIGCELLKNLVLSGFTQIEVIDLDTIELSNLNRQFLFQKCHVGKPKATTARESVLRYNPNANIIAHHDSIMNTKYNVDYFKQFSIVLNALDNKAARSHVNRLCLAADIPLIESGSAGYLGQVTLIRKGITECYDCLPKPAAKTFPGCTIRNTPSESIHCIVWAKHLFNQLFGGEDPDEAVSPDGEDPENMADAGKTAIGKAEDEEAVKRVSTRQWAKETSYNPEKIFNKMFGDDIKYLLSMAKLWEQRRPPTPLVWETCINDTTRLDQTQQASTTTTPKSNEDDSTKLESHKVLTMQKYCVLFKDSVALLKTRLEESGSDEAQILVWDKDDLDAMNFVTSASNLRCHIFSIGLKSQFETKSLAGNIIPAIATTNAIVAGLIVIQALKVFDKKSDDCKTAYVRDKPSSNKVIVGTQLVRPNEKCYVCASKPEITVRLNSNTWTIKNFEDKILKKELHMIQPDVEIDDGTGRIIISSEPGETEENNEKFLSNFNICNETALKCDDFFQNYELRIIILQCDKFEEENTKEYEIVSENQMLKDLQAEIQQQNNTESKEISQSKPELESKDLTVLSDEKKRTYESAFDGEDASKSDILPVETKKLRRSDQNEEEIIGTSAMNEDSLPNNSNSINDASDALSEEDEQIVQPKIVVHKKPVRETIIDDDIIIEENSNDFRSEEEMSNPFKLTVVQIDNSNSNCPENSGSNIENFNQNSNTNGNEGSDDDIIECSSGGSDIIEINNDDDDDSNLDGTHSDSSFVPISNTKINGSLNNGNGHIIGNNAVNNGQNGNISNGNNENMKENFQNGIINGENGKIEENLSNNGVNLVKNKTAPLGNSDDDCITLIE